MGGDSERDTDSEKVTHIVETHLSLENDAFNDA